MKLRNVRRQVQIARKLVSRMNETKTIENADANLGKLDVSIWISVLC